MTDAFAAQVLGVYCERGDDPSFWAEPINAVTNAAFVIAGVAALARRPDPGVAFLALVTVAIGIGSFLFHTLATRAALVADVAPIQLFIAVAFFLATRRLLGLRGAAALIATLAFMAAAAGLPRLLPDGEPWRGLGGYAGGLLGLLGLGGLTASRGGPQARAGRALLGVAALFAVSLGFRTVDGALCAIIPTGSHAVWHLLNAVTLAAIMQILAGAAQAGPVRNVT